MNKKISSKILITGIIAGSLLMTGCFTEDEPPMGQNPKDVQLYEGDTSEITAVIPATSVTQVETATTAQLQISPAGTPPAKPKGQAFEIFRIGNDSDVSNGGTTAKFKTDKNIWVTELWTYHFNNGSGQTPGTIAIRADNGTTYGPWPATPLNKVYWGTKPEFLLPAGSYSVIDSDPATWSQNGGSGGQGMSWMSGIVQ